MVEGEKKKSNNISSNGGKTMSFYQPVNKQDPYVVKAAERAKNKLRNRILELNGGHLN